MMPDDRQQLRRRSAVIDLPRADDAHLHSFSFNPGRGWSLNADFADVVQVSAEIYACSRAVSCTRPQSDTGDGKTFAMSPWVVPFPLWEAAHVGLRTWRTAGLFPMTVSQTVAGQLPRGITHGVFFFGPIHDAKPLT
jgi:hypothetical protein